MTLNLLKVVHLLGAVLWLGSLLIVSLQLRRTAAMTPAARAETAGLLRRTQTGLGWPGLVLTLLGGIGLLLLTPDYLKQGWMHMKLTFVLVLFGLDFWLLGLAGKAREAAGESKAPLVVHILSGLMLIGILVAVFIVRTARAGA